MLEASWTDVTMFDRALPNVALAGVPEQLRMDHPAVHDWTDPIGQRHDAKMFDVIRAVEAAYAVERPEQEWLTGVLDAVGPALDEGLGTVAYFYDVSTRPIESWGFVGTYTMPAEDIASTLRRADTEYVDQSYLVLPFGSASEVPGFARQSGFRQHLRPHGVHDAVAVNALDATGIGCWVGALLPRVREVRPAERERWSYVAAHLATALRLRRMLDGVGLRGAPERYADAVVSPRGTIEHLSAERDLHRHRRALVDAALGIERARGDLRRRDPCAALLSWRALVRGRWSLIDHFEIDGRRYVLACSNDPAAAGPDLLSTRERQIAALVVLGHSNKAIAYELGLSHSTVRVLLARASRKLSVNTRDDFIRRYRSLIDSR